MPREARILFLPQKPYLPIGTLRAVVSYPMPTGGVDDATLSEALDAVGCPTWPGGSTRPATGRSNSPPASSSASHLPAPSFQKPSWLFLDEATAAVDEATEARLYGLVRERLPATAVFSVGHRRTLRTFHSRQLAVRPNGSGPASIVDVTATS